MSAPKWATGMQRLGPGIYRNGDTIDVSEREVCEHFHVPCSEANFEVIRNSLNEAVRELTGEDLPVQVVED